MSDGNIKACVYPQKQFFSKDSQNFTADLDMLRVVSLLSGSRMVLTFGCFKEDIEPYVYMTITSFANYMIFEEDRYIYLQIKLVKEALKHLAENHKICLRRKLNEV